jgi:predicted nucleotidyltransferase
MNDWSDCDGRLLATVEPVVTALSAIISTEQIMLVGAQCRDLLNWRYGCGPPPRSTSDTDVAVALQNWDHFNEIRERFPPVGDTGHCFLIGGIPTDVIPFGEVEAPPGKTSHPPGKEVMNVHGFMDAYQRADELPLPGGLSVRIPRTEGYAVLKLHAWLDRSADRNYKDGPDLALAAYWYAQDTDRLYEEENFWALELHDYEILRGAAALLGADMREGHSPQEFAAVASRVKSADRDLLARHFAVGKPTWPATGPTRRPIVDALMDQLV